MNALLLLLLVLVLLLFKLLPKRTDNADSIYTFFLHTSNIQQNLKINQIYIDY